MEELDNASILRLIGLCAFVIFTVLYWARYVGDKSDLHKIKHPVLMIAIVLLAPITFSFLITETLQHMLGVCKTKLSYWYQKRKQKQLEHSDLSVYSNSLNSSAVSRYRMYDSGVDYAKKVQNAYFQIGGPESAWTTYAQGAISEGFQIEVKKQDHPRKEISE